MPHKISMLAPGRPGLECGESSSGQQNDQNDQNDQNSPGGLDGNRYSLCEESSSFKSLMSNDSIEFRTEKCRLPADHHGPGYRGKISTMSRNLGIAVAIILALSIPAVYHLATLYADSVLTIFRSLIPFSSNSTPTTPEVFACKPHAYSTEIISLEPLLIYIHDFITGGEIDALLAAGDPAFAPSEVSKRNQKLHTQDRTSQSAGLPLENTAVQCVLRRAEGFMGTMLDPAHDEIGPPQLVRYTAGQRFNIHHDWYERPQPARRDKLRKGRSWNRVASFFAVLEDGCTGGETHFPYIKPPRSGGKARSPGPRGEEGNRTAWYEHEDGGGIAFRPARGNAIFWVNLHANGTGDERVMHAGLPLEEGLKTASK